MKLLMCRPEHFGVEYEINPWMHVENHVDRALAIEQWEALHRAYLGLGQEIERVEPVQGLPDMVFTANAAVIWGRRAVLSSFRHAERQGEEPYWQSALDRLGFEVLTLPRGTAFEGAGDALFLGERMFAGWGFRTDRDSHQVVADLLGVELVSLQLIDPRFYHLDTCFSPLDGETAIFHAPAFAPESAQVLRSLVPNPIEVTAEVAAGFACNATTLGRAVVSSTTVVGLDEVLRPLGFSTHPLPMTEFMKSGGGVRCLTLPLEVG